MTAEPTGPADPSAGQTPAVPAPLSDADALTLLRQGDLELEGRLVDASNATLRAVITADGVTARCVYKPVHGERPLWDFPDGTLADREVAAYRLSTQAGFDVVPPTVLRDGPLGPGMCQLWIDEERQDEPLLGFVPNRDVPAGWRRVAAARDERGRPYALAHADDPRLARMAIFDAVVNNADRKGGHVIVTVDGRVYGVDHGVTFHTEDKLRTVLWGWVGEPLAPDTVELLEKLRVELDGRLGASLGEHLTEMEVGTLAMRVDRLLATRCFPQPNEDWPAIPWPPI
ncbi:phosphatidylinositol kinase [Planosporangium mesophilum]|uniref:Phosphatidylinositol kinase n=1 Tax=Planosporangium mesophilum TaxID=689768 RepID=A0A8J3WZS0_9ACTN|nr:phosphatidylinositol kinase [Planosporangium mesophilum]